jgi:predicted transcriptional regulator
MVRPHSEEVHPEPDVVFDVLDDDACRSIVSTVDRPMTVSQISDEAAIPVSTAYKKIEKLRDASLLTEETELRTGGHHRSRYLVNFDRVVVVLDDRREFVVDVEQELATPERQLLGIWSEVRKET